MADQKETGVITVEKKMDMAPNTMPGFGNLQSFELSLRTANLLSKSTLVPKEYQGMDGLPNCVIALNMAARMNADPLMGYAKSVYSSRSPRVVFSVSNFHLQRLRSILGAAVRVERGKR